METTVQIKMDQHEISGILHLPDQRKDRKFPIVIICHGFIGSKVGQHRLFVHAARNLCQAGFAVLRFDYIGCGESTGEYQNTTATYQVSQTVKIIDYATALPQVDHNHIILLGHSLGGGIASVVAGLDKRIHKLILWSPVAVPQQDLFGILGEKLYSECLTQGTVNYQGFILGRDFLTSLVELVPVTRIKDFLGDILIIHGDRDAETPVTNAQIYDFALKPRKRGLHKIAIIAGADHTYNLPIWEDQVITTSIDWLIKTKEPRIVNY